MTKFLRSTRKHYRKYTTHISLNGIVKRNVNLEPLYSLNNPGMEGICSFRSFGIIDGCSPFILNLFSRRHYSSIYR